MGQANFLEAVKRPFQGDTIRETNLSKVSELKKGKNI